MTFLLASQSRFVGLLASFGGIISIEPVDAPYRAPILVKNAIGDLGTKWTSLKFYVLIFKGKVDFKGCKQKRKWRALQDSNL